MIGSSTSSPKFSVIFNVDGKWPAVLKSNVHQIVDVVVHRQCGFRHVATLMGFGEDRWNKVREDLMSELDSESSMYANIFARVDLVAQMKKILQCYTAFAHDTNWMHMPNMGFFIASCYGVVLMYLSALKFITFIPRKESSSKPTEISIGLINNHFMHVFLSCHGYFYKMVIFLKYYHVYYSFCSSFGNERVSSH